MVLSDNAAAYTGAAAFTQVGGADGLVDFGGNQSTSPKQQARIDAVLVMDVTALNIASSDEKYNVQLLGSNDPAFGAGAVEMLGEYSFGKGSQRDGVNMVDTVVGRYELEFTNEQANVKYQYVKVRVTTAGTGPSISFAAFVAVTPEP
jgi:hypothetical protein